MLSFRVVRSKPIGESSMVVDEVANRRQNGLVHNQRLRIYWGAIVVIASTLAASTGCSAWTGAQHAWQYNRQWNDSMMSYRQKCMATKAWHSRKHCYANQKYLKDFAQGFKAGYMDVAAGGNGCTPAFPPREYWGWKYQSSEGQARVAAWFSGYPYGAQAAEQEGVGNWTQIQTSKGIQNEYVEHGRMPSEYNGIYPVPPFDPNTHGMSSGHVIPHGDVIETTVLEGTLDPQANVPELRRP
jgi:hypothetical protein